MSGETIKAKRAKGNTKLLTFDSVDSSFTSKRVNRKAKKPVTAGNMTAVLRGSRLVINENEEVRNTKRG